MTDHDSAESGSQTTDTRKLEARVEACRSDLAQVVAQIGRVIVGQRELVEQVIAAIVCDGHVLLEGVPGLGKTLLIRTVAQTLGLESARIQFTPDLMPADIIGTNTLLQDDVGRQRIEFQPGPVFTQILLADEINRATPKTQSALLEAMQERQVTVGGRTRPLGPPFIVLATQNPLELEGTYPLPEAQLDRFLLKVRVGFPGPDQMLEILRRTTGTAELEVDTVLHADGLAAIQHLVREIVVAEDVQRYAISLVYATHPDRPQAPQIVRETVRYGASPRGAQALVLAAKYVALTRGRLHATYDDIEFVARPALRHRMILGFRAEAEGIQVETLLDEILATVPRDSSGASILRGPSPHQSDSGVGR